MDGHGTPEADRSTHDAGHDLSHGRRRHQRARPSGRDRADDDRAQHDRHRPLHPGHSRHDRHDADRQDSDGSGAHGPQRADCHDADRHDADGKTPSVKTPSAPTVKPPNVKLRREDPDADTGVLTHIRRRRWRVLCQAAGRIDCRRSDPPRAGRNLGRCLGRDGNRGRNDRWRRQQWRRECGAAGFVGFRWRRAGRHAVAPALAGRPLGRRSESFGGGAAGGGGGLPATLSAAGAKQLRAALELLDGCMSAIAPLDRQVLGMRAGAPGAAPLSRGQVASRLGVSTRQVRLSERRGLSGLRTAAEQTGCAGPVGGPFSPSTIGPLPLTVPAAVARTAPGSSRRSPGPVRAATTSLPGRRSRARDLPCAGLAGNGQNGPAWLVVLITVLFSVAIAGLLRELRGSVGAPPTGY